MVKISNFPVYKGDIPIEEVRRTHRRILERMESIRGRTAPQADAPPSDDSTLERPSDFADSRDASRKEAITAPLQADAPPPDDSTLERPSDFADSGSDDAGLEEAEAPAPLPKAAPIPAVTPTTDDSTLERPSAFEDGGSEAAVREEAKAPAHLPKAVPIPAVTPTTDYSALERPSDLADGVSEATGREEAEAPAPLPKAAPIPAYKPPPYRGRPHAKAKLSISVKLAALVTAFLALSLGALTVFISVRVSADVRRAAEYNNTNANLRTAAAVQSGLHGISAATAVFLYDLAAIRTNSEYDDAEDPAARSFFAQNPKIAALRMDGNYFINRLFFAGSGGVTEAWSAAESGGDSNFALIRNVSPLFGKPMLVMRMPFGGSFADVLFAAESIAALLHGGTSFLLDEEGGVLLHSDAGRAQAGANYGGIPFIKGVLDGSNAKMRGVYADGNGIHFAAVRRLGAGTATLFTTARASSVFDSIIDTTIRNIRLSIAALILSAAALLLFSRTINRRQRVIAR